MVAIPGPLQPLEAVGKHITWLGESISSIARGLNLDRRTVREFLRVGAFPERAPRAIGAVDGPAVGELAASVGQLLAQRLRHRVVIATQTAGAGISSRCSLEPGVVRRIRRAP